MFPGPTDLLRNLSLPSHQSRYGSHSSGSLKACEPSRGLRQEGLARGGSLPLDT